MIRDPGRHKVDTLLMHIRNFMGDAVEIKSFARKLEPFDFEQGNWAGTLVIDTTDGPMDERRAWWNAAKNAGAVVIRGSYEGRTETAGGIAVVATSLPFQKTGDNGGNYNSVPSMPLSFLAAGLVGEAVLEMLRSGFIQPIRFEMPVQGDISNGVEEQRGDSIPLPSGDENSGDNQHSPEDSGNTGESGSEGERGVADSASGGEL